MMSVWGWSEATCETIDWNPHGKALQRLPIHIRSVIQKLIHRWLSLNSKQFQLGLATSSKCPCCSDPTESLEHFLLCSHQKQTILRQQLQTQTWFDASDPTLKKIFVAAMVNWHLVGIPEKEDPPNLTIDHYPTKYHALIREQTKIGWLQLFCGRFSQQWSRLHEDYTRSDPKAKDGDKFVSGVIASLWQWIHALWISRCDIKHAKDNTTAVSMAEIYRRDKVKALYDYKPYLNAADQGLFWEDTADDFLTSRDSSTIDHWIKINQHVIKEKARLSNVQRQLSTHPINHYFHRLSTAEPPTRPKTTNPPKKKAHRLARPRRRKHKLTKMNTMDHYFRPKLRGQLQQNHTPCPSPTAPT